MNNENVFEKVYFNLAVNQLTCDLVESNFDSLISDLTSIFTQDTIRSCCIIHPSGIEYNLIGQSEEVVPVLGNCVDPVIWKGYVELKRHNLRKHWPNLVRRLCFLHSGSPSYCAIWRFDENPNFVKLIGVDSDIQLDETSFPSTIYSFSLGNIINGNHFMIHFGSFWTKPPIISYNDDRNTEICIENIKIKHNFSKKTFALKFKLKTTTGDTLTVIESKYRLIYDYKSIKRVHICSSRRNQVRLYLQLSYPPRIFLKAPDRKSGVLKRTRTSDCGDKLSSHVIGNSDVLRFLINIEDDFIITTIYKWQKYHHFDISYGPMYEFVMKPDKPKYLSRFPFSVNYALNCIHSIGYHFLDDLRKNHGGVKVLNKMISKHIKAKKVKLIVEALHRLFDAYLAGKVYNAIEHLKLLLIQIQSERINKRKGSDTNDKTNYRSWTIITPTRTIFTPPIAYQPWQCSTSYLVKVIVRDESFSLKVLLEKCNVTNLNEKLPYIAQSDSNDQFLSSVVQTRLYNSGCLSIAGNCYEHSGLLEIPLDEFKHCGSHFYEIIPKIKR